MKNGANFSRRRFLTVGGLALLAAPLWQGCINSAKKILVKLSGTDHVLGHRLWAKDFPKPTEFLEVPYLIIGGGISGLSAARWFQKNGVDDFLLLEMEDHLGGNASSGENRYSKFPLGAHYLPLPNREDQLLIDFLEEFKIITGHQNGFPTFDETQLSFDPDERLFYRNSWQEGLIPKDLPDADQRQFDDFFARMETYRKGRGADGKYWFDIPVDHSSSDTEIRSFDNMSMTEWLRERSFTSEVLFEYVDYCSRDDFGVGASAVSAWAGIHYFAARKFNIGPERNDTVLTWPEGNARLAKHLSAFVDGKNRKKMLAYDVGIDGNSVNVSAFDALAGKSVQIKAKKVIVCAPQFVVRHIIPDRKKPASAFHYAPWLLATLTVKDLGDNFSFPLSWDNVIFGSKSLGYIYDQHQHLGQLQEKKVITWYHSFASADVKKSRRELYKNGSAHWERYVFDDLKKAHPDIEEVTEDIAIHRLGHGMISPVPGFIWGKERQEASESIGQKIYFAHSDLSGLSIFEEAFHQGVKAVNDVLRDTTLDS